MSKIRGNYLLRASVPCSYTLTNNNRNASFDVNEDKILQCFVMANDDVITPVRGFFHYENIFTIKRARIIPSGASGIKPGVATVAARINFAAVAGIDGKKLDNTDGANLDYFALYFSNWEEWTDFNINVKPFSKKIDWEEYQYDETKKPCSLKMLEHAQFFSVDDYNIQAAYIGETIYPSIEFEVDTAGIILPDGSII